MDEKGDNLVSWVFHNSFPVRVTVSDFNATENKYTIETLELAYDYFVKADKK